MRKRHRHSPAPRRSRDSLTRLVAHAFDVPVDAFTDMPHIEAAGNRELVIDGCKGILEYGNDCIKVDAGRVAVRVEGRCLTLTSMSGDTLVISGRICKVEFAD